MSGVMIVTMPTNASQIVPCSEPATATPVSLWTPSHNVASTMYDTVSTNATMVRALAFRSTSVVASSAKSGTVGQATGARLPVRLRQVDMARRYGWVMADGVAELPSGTVTFLFTDVEGSTRLWEAHGEAMRAALARHDALLAAAVSEHRGHVVKTLGDGVIAVFVTAHDALVAAWSAQRAIADASWDVTGPLGVRMAVQTGDGVLRNGDYVGPALNRGARLVAAAHGGQVVVSHATEEVLRDALPDGLWLIDLGQHRLRDLSRPERVFQLAAKGLVSEFPALRSLGAFRGNLPVQVTSFVGREHELAGLAAELSRARLVTITGVGGVGKTRLAVQVAADVLPSYPDGAWLCELAGAQNADGLVQGVASTLGVSPRIGVSVEGGVLEFLRTRELLLILDNCEHLLGAVGHFVEDLLGDGPRVRVIATSREGLAVAGEHVWPLRSLALPEGSSLAAMNASSAVRLFVERATAVRSGFTLDSSNAAAVGEICRRLDGIPLAIELAAARVAAMSPTEIVGLLDERFRLLTGGRRTAVERHQTLRATVDWSYSLLDPAERIVFDRLGVFAGGFDVAAATGVVAGSGIESWGVLDALLGLVAKSMVMADEAAGDTTRYEMLETLRAYAREQLEEAGTADEWRRRHAEYFTELAEHVGEGVLGPDELAWRARFRAELDNLHAAVTWALDSADDADGELAVRIVSALVQEARMDRGTGIGSWAELALARAATSSPGRRSAVTAVAAWTAYDRGDFQVARSRALAAIEDGAPSTGRATAWAQAHIALSMIEGFAGKRDEARRAVVDGLAAIEAGPDLVARADLHFHLAGLESMIGDAEGARAHAEETLRLAREARQPSALVSALYARGLSEKDPDLALGSLEEGIALSRAGATDSILSFALAVAARFRARAGDAEGALRSLIEAITHRHDIGDRPGMAATLRISVSVLVELGYYEPAAVILGAITNGSLAALTAFVRAELRVWEGAGETVRTELGPDGFERSAALGAAMSYDELVDSILHELDRILCDLPSPASTPADPIGSVPQRAGR
jgi:predicted ATPase/class 3 adenylate cyclase